MPRRGHYFAPVVGAMLEGLSSVKGNVVTRYLYAVDSGDASVKLYVYKKTDTVTSTGEVNPDRRRRRRPASPL